MAIPIVGRNYRLKPLLAGSWLQTAVRGRRQYNQWPQHCHEQAALFVVARRQATYANGGRSAKFIAMRASIAGAPLAYKTLPRAGDRPSSQLTRRRPAPETHGPFQVIETHVDVVLRQLAVFGDDVGARTG
jgi:hypothetical protein